MSAREAFAERKYEVQYHNVRESRALLDEMLKFSKGGRQVPVIVEGDKVTIGYGGT